MGQECGAPIWSGAAGYSRSREGAAAGLGGQVDVGQNELTTI